MPNKWRLLTNWNIYKIGILLVLNSLIGYSQPKFKIGVEVGINSSGLPKWRSLNNGRETYFPLLSPVVGLSANYSVTRHICAGIGAEYYRSGESLHFFREDFDIINQSTVTSNTWESTTYTRLSLPIVLAYHFKLKGTRANTYIGFKTIYQTGGKYIEKTIIQGGGKPDVLMEKIINPFDRMNLAIPAPQKIGLPVIGAGIDISSVWAVNISYTLAIRSTYFEEKRPPTAYWDLYMGHSYSRSDIALALRYVLN